METIFQKDAMIKDLLKAIEEIEYRGLIETRKFFAELLYNFVENSPEKLVQIQLQQSHQATSSVKVFDHESAKYLLAKVSFDKKEYDRCIFYLEKCVLPKNRFLCYLAMFLNGQRKTYIDMSDLNATPSPEQNKYIHELLLLLEKDLNANLLDGYGYYLFGVILKNLKLPQKAVEMLLKAVHQEPMLWSAWAELSTLIENQEQLKTLQFPEHWLKYVFLAQVYLELYITDKALELYTQLQENGFENSLYIQEKIALTYHNKREVDNAIQVFSKIRNSDPYRFENLDIYSNLLYVKDMRPQLAHLAHAVVQIDKYRVETCCIIGNYYSKRGDHQKSVMYFQRALRLNPNYISAWTLMGHEYMEMKNSNAAIQCYRKAVEVFPKDYRAWYGLGQTYEILKLPMYSFFYYKKAQQLRPNDSRMLVALADTYETLNKNEQALKCYWKSHSIGDLEGTALIKMAKLYDKLNECENAAAAYIEFCESESKNPAQNVNELYAAYKYLANYYMRLEMIEEAYTYAFKCLEHDDTKEEGKSLLRSIESIRKRNFKDLIQT